MKGQAHGTDLRPLSREYKAYFSCTRQNQAPMQEKRQLRMSEERLCMCGLPRPVDVTIIMSQVARPNKDHGMLLEGHTTYDHKRSVIECMKLA